MKKILAVALTLALTLTAFAACAESKETLTMATNASFPPYEYVEGDQVCLLYTSPSPRDRQKSRMPSSA